MGLGHGLVRFSIGLDADIERTFSLMRECMVQLEILPVRSVPA
jgi:methionine-gamma-lyase